MSQTVIKVENLGKLYHLGEVGTGTISHDLNRWWARVRGKEDPFAKIGQVNDRTTKGSNDYVWALKNVNFEVKQGEVLGIIGRNGAGKSTLLKILSKVTTPTTGSIKVKGRIASLLEVGTGFHPELTGRENIYLNGAILGMTRGEICSKFDEIVDFAGVERYIDTPVKRYSSGMYVRLAFAVAAFLEPEILIVDEVLAVGDAEFQKKCLGRMKDVSMNEGRTVLFVSHNMHSLNQLCDRGVLLHNGKVEYLGNISECIKKYLSQTRNLYYEISNVAKEKITKPTITRIKIDSQSLEKQNFFAEFDFLSPFPLKYPSVGVVILDSLSNPVCATNNRIHKDGFSPKVSTSGKLSVKVHGISLLPGAYNISVYLGDSMVDYASYINVLTFEIKNEKIESTQIPNYTLIGSYYLNNVEWILNSN